MPMIANKPEEKQRSFGVRLRRWCRSRRCQLWRLLLLPFIPILALIVQTTLSLRNSITNGRDVADVEEQVSRATELGKLVTRLQQERSEMAFFLFTNGSTLRSNLTQRFASTDNAILQMGDLPPLVFRNKQGHVDSTTFLKELHELRYVILTVKHSDGFTFFPSNRSKWNAVDVGPRKDIVGIFAEAVRKRGLKFGVAYTLIERYNNIILNDLKSQNTTKYIDTVIWPDIKLLINNYKPSVLWIDGYEDKSWMVYPSCSFWKPLELLAWIYNESPVRDEIVVSDRWCDSTRGHHGDFYTYNFSARGTEHDISHKWENDFKIESGISTGRYRKLVSPESIMTFEDILYKIVSTVSCGGNALIVLEATRDGYILPILQERLLQLGHWLKINGEAIYNTIPFIYRQDSYNSDVWYTCKEGIHEKKNKKQRAVEVVYAIFLNWPLDGKLIVKDLASYVATEDFDIHMINPQDKFSEEGYSETYENVYVAVPHQFIDDLLEIDLTSPLLFMNNMQAWVVKLQFKD